VLGALEVVVFEVPPSEVAMFDPAVFELVDVPDVWETDCCVSPLVEGVPETWKGPKRMGWKDMLTRLVSGVW